MNLCKCGCGQEIVIQKNHKYVGIPEYIRGHSSRGRKHSPESIEKMRQAKLGRKQTPEHIEKNRQANLGRKHSPETIEKTRQARLGKKHTPEAIEKIRQAKLGKKLSPEAIEKSRQGHLNIFSALERNITHDYCPLFNDEIREAVRTRDDFICQYCDKKQSDLTGFHKKLPVHHIHYDKKNCFPDLITLCISCNIKANTNKNMWESFYMNKLNNRELLLWTKCRNKQEYILNEE